MMMASIIKAILAKNPKATDTFAREISSIVAANTMEAMRKSKPVILEIQKSIDFRLFGFTFCLNGVQYTIIRSKASKKALQLTNSKK